MNWISILFYATFATMTSCYLLTDSIIYNDIFIRPISWSKDDFTIIHHNTRKVLLFAKLGVTLDQLFEAKIFFAGTEEQYLVLKLNNTVKIIDMYKASISGSFTDPEGKNFIYAPQTNSDRLWRFETLELSRQIRNFTLIESINIKGEVDPPGATLSQSLYTGKLWRFVSMFEWKGTIYTAFLMGVQLVVISFDPIIESSERGLNKLIKAFLPHTEKPLLVNLVPSQRPLLHIYRTNQLLSKDFDEILTSFPKLLETCSSGTETFCDLEAFLAKAGLQDSDYCNKDKMPLFDHPSLELATCLILENFDYSISYHLAHGVDRDVVILNEKDKLLMCKFVKCTLEPDEFLKNCKIFNITGGTPLQPSIDTRTANLVLPIKNDSGTFAHLFPIIVPDDLLNCPNCMILGYHHNFMWSQSLGCFKKESSNISDVNVCHPETEATRQLYGRDQVELTISYSYELQEKLGETAYVMIDGIRYELKSTRMNAYKVIVPNMEATSCEIHVERSTGGPMRTSFTILQDESVTENRWPLILLGFSVMLFIGLSTSSVIVIFKRIKERRMVEKNSSRATVSYKANNSQ